MASLTFTPQEFEAFKACWEIGQEDLPDHRWIAVELALSDALGDLDGVDVELDGEVLADARSAFSVGWQGFQPEGPAEEAFAAHMDAAAVVLDIVPAFGMRH